MLEAVFLVIGAVLVLFDGQLIRRSGTTYLKAVYPQARVADSVNQLITVLFHLVVFGALALISTIDMNYGSEFETMIARLGIMLFVLALAHGATILLLARVWGRQEEKALRDELTTRTDRKLDPES